MTMSVWVALVLGGVPVVGWILWWCNNMWYQYTVDIRSSKGSPSKLPPGTMGFPIIGEMLSFLWYFKVVRRPDDYINSKRHKYGDGVGLYKTHLFGKPAVISYSPIINKFVFKSEDIFKMEWPNLDIVGREALVSVQGSTHSRLRNFISRSINQPDALRRIADVVQPRMVAALESWAQVGMIKASKEVNKVTFQNICKLFAGFESEPVLNKLSEYFAGLMGGLRSYPLNVPGTAYYHALQCRKKSVAIFREELENRKKGGTKRPINDMMDGLMQLKDDEGKQLKDMEVLNNIVSVLIGGYESTSLATMWAIYYLAKFPIALEKLRDENISYRKTMRENFITSDEILKMKYTMKVVDETIRLANIAGIVFRTVTEDVEYKGYKIPKGWKMILWLRYLHTNPENFKDPMCFNPDRWNDDPMAAAAYQVFGGGPRLCVGNMLARLQVAIFLHHLSTGYKWRLVNPDAKMSYLSHPKPVDGVEITIAKL